MNWSYIAGFFDGEGHLRIVEPCKGKNRYHQLRICIDQKTEQSDVLDVIQGFIAKHGIGSRIYSRQQSGQCAMRTIVISGNKNCLKFLIACRKHLWVKRAKTAQALMLVNQHGKSRTHLSQAEIDFAITCRTQGLSAHETARRMGRSRQAVFTIWWRYKHEQVKLSESQLSLPEGLLH